MLLRYVCHDFKPFYQKNCSIIMHFIVYLNSIVSFLGDPEDKNFNESQQMLHKFVELTCGDGCVYMPEGHLNSRVCTNSQ